MNFVPLAEYHTYSSNSKSSFHPVPTHLSFSFRNIFVRKMKVLCIIILRRISLTKIKHFIQTVVFIMPRTNLLIFNFAILTSDKHDKSKTCGAHMQPLSATCSL